MRGSLPALRPTAHQEDTPINRLFTAAAVSAAACVFSPLARADYDKTWDYKGNSRTLALNFMADATAFIVNVPGGAIEPDPTPATGYSISDSVRRAALSWNAAGSGWNIKNAGAAMGDIPVNVRMGFIDPDNAANNEFSPPSSDEAKNDDDHGAGAKNVLAFFRITGRDVMDPRFVTSAEIVFNPFASWGIGTNAPVREDMDYDPIIVALHELGHALRLDHTMPMGSTTIGLPRDGDVMRPIIKSGWHQTNKNLMFDRNPNAADIAVATASFGDKLPAPTTAAMAGLGALVMSRRRRS